MSLQRKTISEEATIPIITELHFYCLLLNTILSAEQAMEWGLINRVVADDQVLSAALEIANKLAKGPTRSFGETKRLILTGATESLESQMERESRIIASVSGSADGREGIAAFVAKRTPEFQGK